MNSDQWKTVCRLTEILPYSGVVTRIGNEQVAIFRVGKDENVYAISNYDPFSKAFVLSRGIVGDRQGIPKVASPIYKQSFSLLTGECLDDSNIQLPTWETRIYEGMVQVNIA